MHAAHFMIGLVVGFVLGGSFMLIIMAVGKTL